MSDFIEMEWTCASIEDARRICRYVVSQRLVASAKIIPWIESIYMLNNQLETAQESKIFLVTRFENMEEIKKVILKNSKYQIPEITYHSLEIAHEEYLNWLESSVPQKV